MDETRTQREAPNQFKKPWAPEGLGTPHAGEESNRRRSQKVKGHVTQEDMSKGISTPNRKKGTDRADELANEGQHRTCRPTLPQIGYAGQSKATRLREVHGKGAQSGNCCFKRGENKISNRNGAKAFIQRYDGTEEDIASGCLASHYTSNEAPQQLKLPPPLRGLHKR